ncbi:putative glycosidase CRH2 [Rhodosporidiobolus nylandii]
MPVCQNANYTFMDDSRIQLNHSAFDGDATKYDFTLDKLDTSNNSIVQNGELVLSLTEDGGGTRVSTTRSVLYGTIEASMKSVGAAGVVTAFITMSGVKDEIDWEFTTNNTDEAQNNYYWEGDVNNYKNGGTAVSRNRDTTYTRYGIVWTPSQLDWTINGKSVRTLKKSDTTDGRYPQTPSRVQFSVWPAGVDGASQGTVDWAGGLIDWSSKEYTSQGGMYTAHVQWLSIECYDGSDFNLPFVASNSSSSSRLAKRSEAWPELWERAGESVNSYIWGTNDTNGQIGVSGSDAATIINSPYSTGQNMIVKNGDTKGVTSSQDGGGSGGTGIFGDNAVGNWWAKQKTAVHVGIIIGACAVALFLLVAICTICARSKDRRKAKQLAVKDAIPLVPKAGGGSRAYASLPGGSTADLPGKFERQTSFADSIPSTKGSHRGGPPVPQIPHQYLPQQQYNYSPSPGYGSPGPPYGAQPAAGGYGAHTSQGYAQQWQGYGNGRY